MSSPPVANAPKSRALRADLAERVRALILTRSLAPGSSVNEPRLSVELGVSRTPLREALASLESSGLVRSEPRRGFFVAEMSREEMREIYPIACELDLLALRANKHFPGAVIRELERLNAAFLRAKADPEMAAEIDATFHRTLIGRCPNKRLLRMLESLQSSLERYERVYMGDEEDVERSSAQHTRIIEALRADDSEAASVALAEHWDYGFDRLLLRLEY